MLRFRTFLFLLVFLAALVLGFIAHARNESSLVQKWRREYTLNLLNNFCTTGSYFKECYNLERDECMSEVKRATHKCFEHVNVRSLKDLEKHHIFFGSKVGFCVGKKIEDEHKTNQKKCRDAREWM